jgi:hypothetical protein
LIISQYPEKLLGFFEPSNIPLEEAVIIVAMSSSMGHHGTFEIPKSAQTQNKPG